MLSNDKSSRAGLGGRLARTQTRVFYVPYTVYAHLWTTIGVFAKKKKLSGMVMFLKTRVRQDERSYGSRNGGVNPSL
jgi:hypothetical protein